MPVPIVNQSDNDVAQGIKKKVQSLKEVKGCQQVDVQASGKWFNVEMVVQLDSKVSLTNVPAVTKKIEREVKRSFPNVRLVIHTDTGAGNEATWKSVKDIADATPGSRGVHNIHIQRIDKNTVVDLHLEVDATMTVKQAHATATTIEKKIKALNRGISEVNVHIETASVRVSREQKVAESEIDDYIRGATGQFPEIQGIGHIIVREVGDGLHLIVHAHFDPDLNIEKAHQVSSALEHLIRNLFLGTSLPLGLLGQVRAAPGTIAGSGGDRLAAHGAIPDKLPTVAGERHLLDWTSFPCSACR
jgi:divalent metal cation (Fe/Co/Zn/Cd) transporter